MPTKINYIDIALFKPEIPQNTGNIGRLCVGTNSILHIVGRPSFLIRDKEVKRAGLDYWKYLNILEYENEKCFTNYALKNKKYIIPVSKFSKIRYDNFNMYNCENIILLFGNETSGLKEFSENIDIENGIYIPMSENVRSINLSNSVAILLYHFLSKNNFLNITCTTKSFG